MSKSINDYQPNTALGRTMPGRPMWQFYLLCIASGLFGLVLVLLSRG